MPVNIIYSITAFNINCNKNGNNFTITAATHAKLMITNHIKIDSKTFSKLLQRDFVFNLKCTVKRSNIKKI